MNPTTAATRTPLALVSDAEAAPKPQTAGQRLRAAQAAIKADAQASLTELAELISTCITEARDLAEVDAFAPETREALKQFAANSTGSLDLFSRKTAR